MTTIQLHLLENKSIFAEVDGHPQAYEGGYYIVAGDQNTTEFEIASVPAKYSGFTFSVAMTNARGKNVDPPPLVNNKFMLPVGMAVAGYGQIVITATRGNERAVFLPLKIKVSQTNPSWGSGIISGTIAIGTVETLPQDSSAYAINVGTANDAIINFGIPEGKSGIMAATSGLFRIYTDRATGDIYAEYLDTDTPPQFEFNRATGEIYYIIGE